LVIKLFWLLRKFLQSLFVAFSCLQLIGGPYSVVQMYIWGNMFAKYSSESGLLEGAKETFSGERPCALCHKLALAKKRATDSDHPTPPGDSGETLKLLRVMIPARPLESLVPPMFHKLPALAFVGKLFKGEVLMTSPPSPPPRSVV
jgi:hypothetical protein